ncbi:hypothetical protein BRC93_01900 [Halobacteriales archaeon QS_5_70_15]|nr:MAG: hypothetical protein BRC93_01900 [Halobacteriales archaeon QS_5_70_15]
MTEHTVRAEFEPLNAVRVHTPGLELWGGSVDPGPHLFDAHVPPERARGEHERLVSTLESTGVEVHRLAEDLAAGGHLDALVAEYATVPEEVDLDAMLDAWDPREKLQLVLSRARLERHPDAATSLHVERPVSNVFFQRDTTVVGDRGPVLCEMYEPVRKPEIPIVRRAWEAVGGEFAHEMSGEPLEGGEFLPAGEFALLGVSAEVDGEEVVIRTSYDAGTQLLDAGAVGYDEVGLVRAPLEADRRLREEHGIESRHDPRPPRDRGRLRPDGRGLRVRPLDDDARLPARAGVRRRRRQSDRAVADELPRDRRRPRRAPVRTRRGRGVPAGGQPDDRAAEGARRGGASGRRGAPPGGADERRRRDPLHDDPALAGVG